MSVQMSVEKDAEVADGAEISIEITSAGVKRVLITTNPEDVDGQLVAHLLLAKITPQLALLDAALKAK